MEIAYSKSAQQALNRMAANRRKLIIAKLERLASEPAALTANVASLSGRPGYRLRVGNVRVIFERAGDRIEILAIGPRGGIY